MNISIDRENNRISVAAEDVALFARTKKSSRQGFAFGEGGSASEGAEYRRPLSLELSGLTLTGGLLKR